MSALPLTPSRDNSGRYCELVEDGDEHLPDHIDRCTCETHTGVCQGCNFKITIGPSGTEYGHGRAYNLPHNPGSERQDCPHRPKSVDPGPIHGPKGGESA